MSADRLARFWPAAAALCAALMLAAAHAAQTFAGLEPCELCLKQRDVYWAILAVSLLLVLALRRGPSLQRPAAILIALLFLVEAGLAAYHAGVEWKLWAGPSSCTGAGARQITASDMAALLGGRRQKVVQCDVAAFRFLGFSMAGWNALCALALSGIGVLAARRSGASS